MGKRPDLYGIMKMGIWLKRDTSNNIVGGMLRIGQTATNSVTFFFTANQLNNETAKECVEKEKVSEAKKEEWVL